MKGKIVNAILIIIFIGGLSLLLYPTVSDYWNSFHQTQAISEYSEKIAVMDKTEYKKILKKAEEYNKKLQEKPNQFFITDEEKIEYEEVLDVSGTGVMGYIEVPKIKCSLPIYHGTSDEVLQIAIGHLEWTSLPVGGEGSHSVISGHRGLPSAKLFTDLDKMEEGDTFIIRVLDEVYTYEVDKILIVEPHEIETLVIEKGKDLFTLVTCTPYGVNSHRLFVRGHRVENSLEAKNIRITADAVQIEPLFIAPIVADFILFLLLIWILLYYRKK